MTDTTDKHPRFLPLGIDLRGTPCVVVGGGAIGTRKVHTLVGAGAAVRVVAPEVSAELAALVEAGAVRWVRGPFRPEQLDGAFLAVAATDDDAVNLAVVEAAGRRGVLVCDASSADRSRVSFGALLERDTHTIAVFSDGRDPGRARAIRDHIAKTIVSPKDGD
jgi:uroporphyrin-III C-methyltransferase/precorrin-2 dehydrogenase/sirohydrochlorin ferrochelatase